jgi:hypothetical protein
MAVEVVSLQSAIEEKIAWAQDLHRRLRRKLLQDPTVAQLLDDLRTAIQDSHREMVRAGVAAVCAECEEKGGGSCCGAGLENHYSGLLLLINLLLDVPLPTRRRDPASCFFLGGGGCRLLARHVLCVNYLCKKITDHVDPDKLRSLREKEGVELELLFLLNECIHKQLLPQSCI